MPDSSRGNIFFAGVAPAENTAALWRWLCVAAAALALAGCDDRRSESNPGSTPAAVGSGSTSSGRSDAGTPSSGVEVRTPVAPDIRSGGSSGSAGMPAVPDTSGGPSTGSTGSGSSNVVPGQATTDSASPGSGAVSPGARGVAGSTSSGNTNSTPQSNTGGQ